MIYTGEINSDFMTRFHGMSKKEPLVLCSEGGCPYIALGAVDLMRARGYPEKVIGVGKVFSAALPVLICAKKRLAYTHTRFFDHTVDSELGKSSVITQEAELKESKILMQMTYFLFQNYSKYSAGWWERRISKSNSLYFGVKEALEWGVIDEVIDKEFFELVYL